MGFKQDIQEENVDKEITEILDAVIRDTENNNLPTDHLKRLREQIGGGSIGTSEAASVSHTEQSKD